MRKLRRVASVLMTVVLICSCLVFSSSAEGEAAAITVSLSETELAPGDTVTVSVNISNNYNAITMRWPVLYSTNIFELVGIDGNAAYPINTHTEGAIVGSADYSTSTDFLPAAYSSTDYGVFTFQWVAKGRTTPSPLVGAYNQATAQACFTFQLKVKEGATGTGSVFIPGDSTDFYYKALTDTTDALSFYDVPASAYTFTAASATVTAAVLTPEIVPAAGSNVQLKTVTDGLVTKTVLCGFNLAAKAAGTLASYEEEFTISNDGTYTLTNSGSFGTGTVINLFDSQGTAAGSYEVIIYGDVSGDGEINITDVSVVNQIIAGDLQPEDGDIVKLASDVDGNAAVDITDCSKLNQAIAGDIDFTDFTQA